MNAEPWVTAEQVAQHLGAVKDTVYRWRERKGLPAHKIGRLWKFQLCARAGLMSMRTQGVPHDIKPR